MGKYDNLKGKTFWNLTFISEPEKRNYFCYYTCRCKCGNEKVIRADSVLKGSIKSCGCLSREQGRIKGTNSRKQNIYRVIGETVYVELAGTNEEMVCDIEDWERLKDHYWVLGTHGYARTNRHKVDNINATKFHIAVMGKSEGKVIDHINRNKLDNRKSNLRFITQQANIVNRGLNKNNKSGCPGVYLRKDNKRWKSVIFYNGKEIPLGHYENKEDAIKARKEAEKIYFEPLFN